MRLSRGLVFLFCLFALAVPAHAQKTPAAIQAEIVSQLPSASEITAAQLRAVLSDIAAAPVYQTNVGLGLTPTPNGAALVTPAAPILMSGVTGQLSCPTCVTTTGGSLTATPPITLSSAGVIGLNLGTGLNATGGNLNIASTITAAGPIGSATAIPTLTYNAQGQLTTVTTTTVNPTQVNSVAFPSGPSTNTVPVVTGSNQITYEAVPNAALANSTISGIALGNNLDTLTFGTHLAAGGTSYNGAANVTITTDCTAVATASTLMCRDSLNQVAATTFTGALTGHASSDCALAGCTMAGNIAMGSNNITGLGTINGLTIDTTTGTLDIANGKTLTDTSGVGADLLLGATGGGFAAYGGTSSAGNVLTALSASGVGSFIPYGLTGNSTLVETTSGGLITASLLPTATSVAFGAVKVPTIVSGDVVTGSGTPGVLNDSGTLLSSLAPLASPTFSGTVTFPDSSTLTSSGHGGLKALGVNETVPGTVGNVNISGQYQIAGSQIALGNLAGIAAYSLVGNTASSSAVPAAFTIGGLTAKSSPASTDLLLIQDQAASGALKYATIAEVIGSVTSGVSSLNSLTGALTLTATGGEVITSSGTSIAIGGPGGFVNKFHNGTFDVWQRGTSSLTAYTTLAKPCVPTADGWCVQQTGAAFTCAQDTGTAGALFSLKCVGGSSNTDTAFTQRIESYVAAPLAGKVVTAQFWYKQTSGSTITPKISACYASATDNFTTCTSDLAATSVTGCATATWCLESYTWTASASATQGYSVTLDCETALTSAEACWVTAADIRATPGVSTGVNSNPPPAELRPIAAELVFCQRYYQTSYPNVAPGTITGTNKLTILSLNGDDFYTLGYISLAVTMRTTPTYTMYSPNTGTSGAMYNNNTAADLTGFSFYVVGASSFYGRFPSGGMTANYAMSGQWTASAEL